MTSPSQPPLQVSEMRAMLSASEQPVFHLSRTAPHLFGVDRWVPGLRFIQVFDRWDGAHPSVFTPSATPSGDLRGGIDVVNWLLRNTEVRAYIAAQTPAGYRPQIIATFFNEEAERLCDQLGYDLILTSIDVRTRLDSKLVTTRIADSVGVSSVPNVLTTVSDWQDLVQQAERAGLGTDLVLQTAYGDSGNTTYFVSDAPGFESIRSHVVGPEIKVMKRITHLPIAMEAVLTRSGTVVGPCESELTGFAELTPNRGGWSGNESSPELVDAATRRTAVDMIRRLGDRLAEEGYRGIFEVDLLLDTDSGALYLGELNPRISGASVIAYVASAQVLGIPLMAFHLLEFSGVDFTLDTQALAEAAAQTPTESWSQMVIRHTTGPAARIDEAPPNGRYRIEDDGTLRFVANDRDWYDLESERDVYFSRVLGAGDSRGIGDELGIIVTRGRLQTPERELTGRALLLNDAFHAGYLVTPLTIWQRAMRFAGRALRAVRTRLRLH